MEGPENLKLFIGLRIVTFVFSNVVLEKGQRGQAGRGSVVSL